MSLRKNYSIDEVPLFVTYQIPPRLIMPVNIYCKGASAKMNTFFHFFLCMYRAATLSFLTLTRPPYPQALPSSIYLCGYFLLLFRTPFLCHKRTQIFLILPPLSLHIFPCIYFPAYFPTVFLLTKL